ncbi:hypothetical protein HCH15_08780 [Corynebacterium testudinoris]|uniref:Uncharacterized protein n=1 Tax=Corynebacterium testudinoris TaxID=136857 RepID=A0A0G3HF20_9CORY|nr:hypothetical protein [Corynebacterium testudinoris]AKK09722.1 hypothetical protein CTEST_11575 [Corynebacterium testudinoris]MBX8996273.1 hypothetical protein [Corynebacterium testudinoris]
MTDVHLHSWTFKSFPAEAALLSYSDDPDWAYSVSFSMVGGEYEDGVDEMLDLLDLRQVTPVPRDVVEAVRKLFTDPEEWSDEEIEKANRVLDKVAALGRGVEFS